MPSVGMSTDVADLLRAYRECRVLAERPPASITLPGRPPFSRWLRAVHIRLRPTFGTERWTRSRVRRRVEALERALAERVALGPASDRDTRDRDCVLRFKESLPAAPSRVLAIGGFVAIVVLAQAVVGLAATEFTNLFNEQHADLASSLGALGPNPDVSAASSVLRALGRAPLELLLAFVGGVALSTYIICRASVSGYRLSTLALGGTDGLGVPRRGADLTRAAQDADVMRLERSVFADLGVRAPREFPFDLAAKSLLAAVVICIGFYGLRSDLVGVEDRKYWLPAVLVGGVRLAWLARASFKRRFSVAWLAVPTSILVIAALLVSPEQRLFDQSSLPAPENREFSFALSLNHDLTGADLRNRDLQHFYLHGKNLSGANLSGANVSHADLSGTRLRDAELGATSLYDTDLSDADLRGARIDSDTDFQYALLCGADLRQTDLEDFWYSASYDARTKWPGDGTAPRGAELVDHC
jgi:hypothetical protein